MIENINDPDISPELDKEFRIKTAVEYLFLTDCTTEEAAARYNVTPRDIDTELGRPPEMTRRHVARAARDLNKVLGLSPIIRTSQKNSDIQLVVDVIKAGQLVNSDDIKLLKPVTLWVLGNLLILPPAKHLEHYIDDDDLNTDSDY